MSDDADAWAGERVARWLRQAPHLERQLAPVSAALFDAAEIAPGESVLDVGCGTGPTTRDVAERTGAAGHVTGLDVSGDMLAAAASVPTPHSIEWVPADVVSWIPPRAAYDVVLSRFGVMFFSDPARAVSNLAAATRPGGRLAVAVWAERGASPLFEVPYRAAVDVLAARGVEVSLPDDQGPFSWRDPVGVTALLEDAGWSDVAIATHTLRLPFGGGLDPEAAAETALDFGPTRLVLLDVDDATRAAARDAIAAAFADPATDCLAANGTVQLDAVVRIITARR